MSSLAGRVGIVTGAASGIGRAAALAFARQGAALVLADLDADRGEAVGVDIRKAGGQAIFVKTDVAIPDACLEMVASARRNFGKLDFALNNAAVQGPSALLADYPLDGWASTLAVNLSGAFYCLRAEIPLMLEGGGGAIVNVTSISGLISLPNQSAYVAAKHGLVGLTKVVCNEYGGQGIRCNAIAPGATDTPMLALSSNPQGLSDFIDYAVPSKRIATPEEVAEAAVWLCSPASSYVNGVCLPVDGGFLVR